MRKRLRPPLLLTLLVCLRSFSAHAQVPQLVTNPDYSHHTPTAVVWRPGLYSSDRL